jgi:hypothetical protein
MKVGTKLPVAPLTAAIPIPEETAVLVNISESSYYAERTYGMFRIEGCRPGTGYTTALVHAHRAVIDMGDRLLNKRDSFAGTQQFIVHADEAAMDLVRQWNTDIWGIGSTPTGELAGEAVMGFAGVFVADSLIPTEDELTQARELLALSDAALVDRANAEWDQFHSPMTIHAGWKRAAKRLGVDAGWLYTVSNKTALPDCPHCGSKLLTMTAKVCSVCLRDVVTPSDGAPKNPRAAAAHKGSKGAKQAENANQAA